ncbi:PIN domain-containing protein [Microbacterium sp. JB110]|nr:PIN domain-containing protein [Microbacterium sp. JB110]SJM55193.1 Toxin 1, PIN domain [Frigoribacterium sp. JB110]
MLVVDASVLVTLLIDPGDAGERVADRMRGADLLAPTLVHYEVANVLRRRCNAGMLSPVQADQAFEDLQALSLLLWPFDALSARAWSLGHNLSAYDAAYVALAETAGATLLTRDRRLANAHGVRCAVEVIE